MMGLTLVVGFLVDDAIVVLENIVRHMEMGKSPYEAAFDGSKEISSTVLSMTLSLSSVFIPVIFMPGIMGRMFHEFGMVVVIAVLFSGFLSLTLTPMLCSRFLRPSKKTRLELLANKIITKLIDWYAPMLDWVLTHRWVPVAGATVSFLLALILLQTIPQDFLPAGDTGAIQGLTVAPQNVSLHEMTRLQNELTETLSQNPYVENIIAVANMPEVEPANQGVIFLSLIEPSKRPGMSEVIEEVRSLSTKAMTLDRDYAKSLGIGVKWVDLLVFFVVVMAVVIGIRSVGVVLMSAMLIAPAVVGRQFSNRLSRVFIIAGICGLVSGFLGNYLSLEISNILSRMYPNERVGIPTGPMIVLVASTISIMALLFAPERGFFMRRIRANLFRNRCIRENLLKTMWKAGEGVSLTFPEIVQYQSGTKVYLKSMLHQLVRCGWVNKEGKAYVLTNNGFHRASHIVRLHRLWEVYLVEYLGIGAEKVHHSAEEMEHIITPELERKLTKLLQDPSYDPHHQPIPKEDIL